MFKYLLSLVACVVVCFVLSSDSASATEKRDCWIGQIQVTVPCPPPPAIKGNVTSTDRFRRECVWLEFPVGPVNHPVVFFTRESDARCLGANWRRECPECTAWINGQRGPVKGPAARAVVALRLHNGLGGLSVPREAFERIRMEAGWCDYGQSAPDQSHHFFEHPW
jgi:hypothetical protein